MTRNEFMKSSSSTHLVGWAFLLLLTLASLVFGYLQLDGLPDLGVRFGPDLTVRAVPVDRETDRERQEFKRGDRLVALQGQPISDLRELRAMLQSLPSDSAALDPDAVDENGEIVEDPTATSEHMRKVSYQIVRPLYRFPIALQGKPEDPTALPPGVESSDRLVELDGRQLQTKIGPEGVRSIVASRPEALLVFERKNAVFFGSVMVPAPESPHVVFGIFGVALVIMAGLWWFRSRELEPLASVVVGLETLCIGWIALFAFEYQWVLSDNGLSAVLLVAFSMVRPLAFFAHNIGDGRGTQAGWTALLMGIAASGAMLGLYLGGPLTDAEQALHVVALIAGLFVVYEIFVASIGMDAPRSSLGEGNGYIAWILVLALFSALLAWYLAPISFEENRWRWFATVIVGLVWFGDLLYCFRGVPAVGWALISHQSDRHREILEYLAITKMLLPGTRSFLVVSTRRSTYTLAEDAQRLQIQPNDDALHDAMSILVQERARIPLSPMVERQTHPMAGIAEAMNMALALPLTPPEGTIEVEDLHVILVAIHEGAANSDEPPEEVGAEAIDLAQGLLSAEVWVATLIEAYAAIGRAYLEEGQRGVAAAQPVRPGQESRALLAERRRASELEAELKKLRLQGEDAEAEVEAVAEPTATGERVASFKRPAAEPEPEPAPELEDVAGESIETPPDAPVPEVSPLFESPLRALDAPPSDFRALLEPELVDALEYLLASPEALVLGGAPGSGKEFIARVAQSLDGAFSGELWSLDAQDFEGWPADVIFEKVRGQSVLISRANRLSDPVLNSVYEAVITSDIRLYLAFDDPNAEDVSVLHGLDEALQQRLEHRELIVPNFAHRPSIFEAVWSAFLEDACVQYGAGLDEWPYFSDEAVQALRAYDFPGNVEEVRVRITQAVAAVVARADGQAEILREDLGI